MKIIFTLATAFLTLAITAQTYTVDFKLNNPDGIYKKGEKIVILPQLLEDGKPAIGKDLRCILYHGKKHISTVDLTTDKLGKIETSMDTSGWCKLMVVAKDNNGKTLMNTTIGRKRPVIFQIGAMVAPLEIKQGAPTPADFASFWDNEKAKLKSLPMNVQYKPIPDTPKHRKANFVTVDIGKNFRPVNGILHIPANAKPKSLPIYLHVHGAGVHNPPRFQWAPPGRGAAKGPNIFFNLNAHGIPNDKPLSYYKNLREGELKNYPFQNSADQEKYYMKGMILRLTRALEFLKTLAEWNGKDIVVSGGSQGGAQALFAAGIDPQVTEIYADVPAMCDHGGELVNRNSGWPKLYFLKGDSIMIKQDYNPKNAKSGNKKMITTAGYFDAANFAKNINCKTFIRAGGIDSVCPPSSIFAAYNNIPSQNKEIIFAPLGNHCRGIYKDTKNIKLATFQDETKVK